MEKPGRFRPFLPAGIFVLALLPYLTALTNGFVLDDPFQIKENPWIRDFSSVWQAFSAEMWGFDDHHQSNYYRPLVHVLEAAVYAFSGVKPWGYHLLNLLLHAGSSVLAYLISLRLLAERLEEKKAFLPRLSRRAYSFSTLCTWRRWHGPPRSRRCLSLFSSSLPFISG